MADHPDSPLSSLSTLSSSPPQLDDSTLAILDAFLPAKADEEFRYNELATECSAAYIAGLALDGKIENTKTGPPEGAIVEGQESNFEKGILNVNDYLLAFGEDWKLSQFWYTPKFANKLACVIRSLCPSDDASIEKLGQPFTIAFLCSPTAFVAFSNLCSTLDEKVIQIRLLEYDQRFAALAPGQYIPYDLNEPDEVPQSLLRSVHLAIVDPPYLNKASRATTNAKLSRTLSLLLHPTEGRLLLVTSTSIEDILRRIYTSPPLGPLHLTKLHVEHGHLANDFVCWRSWPSAAELGGEDEGDVTETISIIS
ncbi:hypothetical protein AX17_006322 [Amanita inopinata Kibby_2008]|nr:hypothetical protein AX17_006322 [Amanita inopinata Kibby_2008]